MSDAPNPAYFVEKLGPYSGSIHFMTWHWLCWWTFLTGLSSYKRKVENR